MADETITQEEETVIPVGKSILSSVKKQLGIAEEYDSFDPELIIHINSVFGILNQMGVGPSTPFTIEDKTAVWDSFLEDKTGLEMVKTYVYMKVRMIFDTPSGAANEAMKNLISELEWRLYSLENFKEDEDEDE